MSVANKYKGNYRMDFMDKDGKKIECKISYIPVRLCEFPNRELVLVAVYGFGAQPMLLLTNLKITEKTLFNRSKSLFNALEDRGILQV
ncbi:MAG: hypothetical protein HFH72_11960 [Lachnospiraceae bacterium]|nr:hypothetical protein [Lachnospiraceae bacterium]